VIEPSRPLRDLETPALLLDRGVLGQNLAMMRDHLRTLGVSLRPHVKTTKSIDVIRLALAGLEPRITVSTLHEADHFLQHGITDMIYAVGIAPGKLKHAAALIRRGAQLTLILDNVFAAQAVIEAAAREQVTYPVLIELDVDGHRAGVRPDSDLLLEIGKQLSGRPGVELRGVLTHAGGSYACRSDDEIRAMAERERAGAVLAAERLRAAGMAAPVVSVGSTPTALFARDLRGVTEVRAGVYMLFDLVMAGLGVCRVTDIASSVLVSVIGHNTERGWIMTDGGWMALSRDRGTAAQSVDQGFGLVRDHAGRAPPDDLIVVSANQEHGIVGRREGGPVDPDRYPVGTLLRILPNHACATSAQHQRYEVLDEDGQIVATWPRINGW
jgi:D-serine deaminase-like pyridoxal phosphate-dependent protein